MTMVKEIAGKQIDFDSEGFMTDLNQWSEDVAAELAQVVGIDQLSDDHWNIIKFSREDYQIQGTSPTLRRIKTESGVPIKQIYKLFPKKPAKKVAFIAGLPKPTGCV